jgi:small subunit ribosomal protein S16
MLAIRLQRHGRKGYATYRFVVQDARRAPSSGRVVAQIGNYNPHTKDVHVEKDKAQFYLDNGAQPSERVAKIFKAQKIKMPEWVREPLKQKGDTKNPDKLKKDQPKEAKPAEKVKPEEKPETQVAESDKPAEEIKPEEKPEEKTEAKTDNKEEEQKPKEKPEPK